MNLYLTIVNMALVLALPQGSWAASEAEILREIFARNDFARTKPPGVGPNGTTDVQFGIAPMWLEMTAQGVIRGKMWYRFLWADQRLTWKTEEDLLVSSLKVHPTQIWMPDLFPYNRFDSHNPMFAFQSAESASNAVVMPTGSVLFVPEMGQKFICSDVDLDNFWGEQECFFKFGSWTYNGHMLNVVPYEGKTELDLEEYEKSSPLWIKRSSIKRVVKYYPCCVEPFPHLLISVTVQRKFIVQENGAGVIFNPLIPREHKDCV
ncbi:hypothetical protein TCAL_10581 [Tigriopus californicus]|uniref:Neurotransmitter-gated ion-channel ligand-binding domain-containing protein n=1 Tax=Tigriopus californicus TaxID=6832 RepID=A0A553PMN3_TIGCA|nr:acetylcholine receptor subunit alpha-type acr-16-like [Tigriopus californicus]TRY78916.1 hypothetical protein TCAL_10581 [Tigriopus californicus]